MENPRPDKVAIVDEVRGRLSEAESVIVTEYRGLSVEALAELRSALRPAGGKYKVYKNTLVRLASTDVGDEFTELLAGPTALAFTETTPEGEPGDVVSVAKALRDFGKANPDLVIKGGLFEGEFIDADGVKQLADVEPREVLLAKLAGLMAAPMQQFASLMQALPRDLAYGLQALVEQGGGAPATPEPEAAAEEADAAPEAEAASDEPAPADDAAAEAPADDAPADATADEAAPEAAPAADEAAPEAEADTEAAPAAESEPEEAAAEAAEEPEAE